MRTYGYVNLASNKELPRRAHLLIQFTPTFNDVVEILAAEAAVYGLEWEELSKADALKLVKAHLRSKGNDGHNFWAEDVDEEDAESYREQAREIARKYWGEDFRISEGTS